LDIALNSARRIPAFDEIPEPFAKAHPARFFLVQSVEKFVC
jgi:hypothetical protein